MLANCVVCGKPFDAQGAAKTCSTECRKVRRRERERAWYAANPEKAREKAREADRAWQSKRKRQRFLQTLEKMEAVLC